MEPIVLGTILATWASFLVSLLTNNLEVWPFILVFPIPFFVFKFEKPTRSFLFWVTIIFWGLFLTKLFSQMMVILPDGIWAGGSNVWGDWAGHMGYVANWLYGVNWPPQNPWYAGIRLSYPFLFDFTSAILVKMGLAVNWSFQLPGIIFSFAIVVLLFKLTEKLTNSSLAASLAVLIFMFSGGLGFLFFNDVKELTHSYEHNIQWVNFVISEMVPQRGILIGLTAALTIFLLWIEEKPRKYFLAGIIAGLIPFFHAHTFLAVSFISGCYLLLRPKKIWFFFFIPAVALTLPQFIYFLPQVSGYSPGFIRMQLGWAAHVQNDNWLWFWLKNIGLLAILIPIFLIQSFRQNRKLFWLYLPFILIFVACNLWIFQPWENDNSKLLRFWYLGSSILVAWGLAKLKPKILIILFLVIIIFSGAYDAFSWLDFSKNKLQMWSREDIRMAEVVRVITPQKSVFLTNDNHNHWVVDLAGRKIVMGFRGWLWSWGINYSQRETDVGKMFRGEPETAYLLTKYGVNYVIIGPGEISNFKANEEYYQSHYPLVLDMNGQKIFFVSSGIINSPRD